MRLWHRDLIKILPKQQLLSQWRECCCIARNIKVNGTPNHILVNKIIRYSDSHLDAYARMIYAEMWNRGYKCNWDLYAKHRSEISYIKEDQIFKNWHNDRYLKQCLYNLQEKYDCGGIPETEWSAIYNMYKNYFL
jgi:uncharacterized protein (TIGR02328 family)